MDGGGVGLLPALCLLRMAWVLLTLLTESCLPPFSGSMAGQRSLVTLQSSYTSYTACNIQHYWIFLFATISAFRIK